jgi:hypothetical protein
MAWVTTEAVRTKEPVLKLGPSLSSFMADLGLLPRGGILLKPAPSHVQKRIEK